MYQDYPPCVGWFDPYIFPFNKMLEDNWEVIRDEALALLRAGKFYHHEQSRASSEEVFKLADQWLIFSLHRKCKVIEANVAQAPRTWELLSGIKELRECRAGLTYFSLVPAGGEVAPHVSKGKVYERIRNQLCLQLPMLREGEEVEITVNGQSRTWDLGKVITFDDAYRHHVRNHSSSDRLVLIYDVNYN